MNFFRRFVTTFAIVVGLMFTVSTVAVPFANAEITKASAVANTKLVQQSDSSPVIAIILAILLPGLGHIYVGKAGTGILILALCIINWCIIGFLLGIFGGILLAPLIHLALIIWDAWGAYNVSQKAGGKGDLEDVEDRVKEGLDDDARMVNPFVRPASAVAF